MRRLLLAVLVGGCTPTGPGPGARPDAPAEADPVPAPASADGVGEELGKLQLRDHTVTIELSASGPLYTVADTAGTLVLERAHEAEFQRTLPALFRDFETSFARKNVDARAEMPIQADL